MSIKVMSMVFDRYPAGGNERLLALALADHAKDDGTRIWPSVAELSRKTLQSERTVQRQVAAMVARGWLEVVHVSTGRPGDTNEYRIAAAWIEGGELQTKAPETGVKLTPVSQCASCAPAVDKVIHTGVTNDETGDTAVSPESSGTIRIPIPPIPPVETGGCGKNTGTEQPKQLRGCNAGAAAKRQPWRWADRRSGIEQRGEQLGLGRWDESKFQHGQGPPFRTYKANVFVAHLAAFGVAVTPADMIEAMTSERAANHAALLRQLAEPRGPST